MQTIGFAITVMVPATEEHFSSEKHGSLDAETKHIIKHALKQYLEEIDDTARCVQFHFSDPDLSVFRYKLYALGEKIPVCIDVLWMSKKGEATEIDRNSIGSFLQDATGYFVSESETDFVQASVLDEMQLDVLKYFSLETV